MIVTLRKQLFSPQGNVWGNTIPVKLEVIRRIINCPQHETGQIFLCVQNVRSTSLDIATT